MSRVKDFFIQIGKIIERWLKADKVAHFAVTYIAIDVVMYILGLETQNVLSFVVAVFIALIVGLISEWYDVETKGKFDYWDIVAGLLSAPFWYFYPLIF